MIKNFELIQVIRLVSKGNENAKNNLEILSPKMTPQQISQAQNEAAQLWKKIRVQKNNFF
jgi:hypothetical protein